MKSKEYFRLALFVPYFAWILTVFLTLSLASFGLRDWLDFFQPLIYSYCWGIFCWGIPYTILIIILIIWGAARRDKDILRVYLFAPFFLAIIIDIGLIILNNPFSIGTKEFSDIIMRPFLGPTIPFLNIESLTLFSIFYGYFFVGITFLVYKYLKAKGKLQDDSEESA